MIKKSKEQKITDICLAMKKRGFGVNRWNGVGGKVEEKETIETAAKREVKEEAGIEIYENLKYINNVAFIRPDGIPVILVKFAAKYKAGDIVLEKGAFTDFRWVDKEEVKTYDCIQGVHKEVEETINLFYIDHK